MKKILLFVSIFALSAGAYAQKVLPEIKKGTVISSSAFVNGQEFPVTFTIKSLASPVTVAWSVTGYGDGSFEMSDKALESATKIAMVGQPELGASKLPDDETFNMISKAAYKTLMASKTLTYSGIKFKVKENDTNPMKIDGKEIDATHIVSEDGKFEFWVLNNPAFPFVLQSIGMPTDFLTQSIK